MAFSPAKATVFIPKFIASLNTLFTFADLPLVVIPKIEN